MEEKNFKPTVFFAWNGKMTDEELISQINSFYNSGVGGLFLHARAGLEIEYLGTDWMRAYSTTINECKKLGLDVWIYDEQGWPSGFAGGRVTALGEDYCIKYLVKSDKFDNAFASRLLAAYIKSEDGYALTNIDNTSADLYIYYNTQQHYVDLLNPEVTKEFIKCTHEEYKKRFGQEFGKTIRGVFTDEPQIHVSSLVWSVAIPESFYKKYGYSVFAKLYLLFEDTGDSYQKFRYDYYQNASDLFVNNYTKQIYEWCQSNNLTFTGHFAGEDSLCIQIASNTGVMRHYQYMHQIGIDYLGRRLNPALLLKQAQSVAHQFDRSRILSEIYACTGNGVSFKELAWIWGHQASFGVNFPCMSIAMNNLSGVRKRDYPVFISEQQPWWQQFKYFTNYITNINNLTTTGVRNPRVMVLSSVGSVISEPICSLTQKIVSSNYRKLVENLVDLQIDFDIADEALLKEYGKVQGNKITIKNGQYDIVILPEQTNIASFSIDILQEFYNAGGKIIQIQQFASLVDGAPNEAQIDRLRKICATSLQERKGILQKYFVSQNFVRNVYVCDYFGKLVTDVITSVKNTCDGYMTFVFNPSTNSNKKLKIVADKIGSFYKINLVDNSQDLLSSFGESGGSWAEFELKQMEFAAIKFVEGKTQKCEKHSEICYQITPKLSKIDDNALVIDYGRFNINSGEYSSKQPLVKILENVYERLNDYTSACLVNIKYDFTADYLASKMYLVAETTKCKSIIVNGEWVDVSSNQYYIDKSFKKYDITKSLKLGENSILLSFEIAPLNLGYKLNEVHDSVRNRFSYPVETESIFIVGDFDVVNTGKTEQAVNCYFTDGEFKIVKPSGEQGCQITSANSWFYCGRASFSAQIEYQKDDIIVQIPSFDGAIVVVKVNNVEAGAIFLADGQLNITKYMQVGKNNVEFVLYGNLRNILGPHHHHNGESEFTGVHTFTGEYGNGAVEDLSSMNCINNIWTDKYSFVKLGIDKIVIKSEGVRK